jgi:hypothetical protein
VWLLPCRLLRRKNIGEALLLARWLRPGAWVITTGGPSSKDEHPYERKLRAAAEAEGWRLKLGALASAGGEAPSVRELLEASEVVLMTSIQEGFGLPYLEAAGAARPLAGRGLSNIMPDLRWLGFRFPQLYKSLLIPPDLFDARAEQARQRALFRAWKERLPGPCRAWARAPEFLRRPADSAPVDFARLTLTAQLEVLRKPVEESWAACASLNPFLRLWRSKAEAGRLEITPWPEAARDRISGVAYGRQLFEFARKPTRETDQRRPAWRIQAEFMRARLSPDRLYPLLWSIES